MQFKTVALAFAATALAQSQTEDVNAASLLQVLQTALPSSLLAEAYTNSAAVASQISSQFAAGQTPSWYSDLPSNIQTYLVPATTGVAGGNGSTISNGTIINGNQTSNSNSTTTSTRHRATITSTSHSSETTGGSGSGSGSQNTGAGFQSSSASESGNAAAPTAIIGAGLAGAVGFVGLLAL